MNTFKLAVLSVIPLASFSSIESKLHNLHKVIHGASYGVMVNDAGFLSFGPRVRFYTFNGNYLKSIDYDYYSDCISSRLDKYAPKPQPVVYKIEYRKPRIETGLLFNKHHPGGYWIVFYDKNKNVIAEYQCEGEDSVPTCHSDLDLSIVKKIS